MKYRPKSTSKWGQSIHRPCDYYHVIISQVPECIIGIDILMSYDFFLINEVKIIKTSITEEETKAYEGQEMLRVIQWVSGRAQIKVRFVPIRKTVFLTTKLSPLQTILWFYSRILDEFSKYSDILNSILTCIIRYHVSRAPGSRFWKSSLGDSNIQPVWEPLSDDIRGLTTTIDT